MAKWGEGDPRWIVEERSDGTNVNNWHWAEKNADNWSKEKLKDLLVNKQLSESGLVHLTIESVESCEGEARVNNRKGKVIVFFEWNIVLAFRGFVNWQGKEVRGKLEILNFSEDIDDLELNVNILLDPKSSRTLSKIIEKGPIGTDIRDTLLEYVTSLQNQYSGESCSPVKTTVKSRTVISDGKALATTNTGNNGSPGTKSQKKTVGRKSTRKNKRKKTDDFLFYLSLISLVGFSAVLAIKIVRRL